MKKVSIVLPVYNGENHVAQSIESVLDQTYAELELIIVDDNSGDRTAEIAERYAAKDARVVLLRNGKNLKLPRALNAGFGRAKGTYRTWTSHDNLYAPDAIEKMVAALEEHPEAVLGCADVNTIDCEGNKTGESRMRPPADIYLTNTVGACFLYRASAAEAAGEYDPGLFLAEDYDYWIRLRRQGAFLHLPEILYDVRVHSGSLSATRAKENNIQYVKVLKKHFGYLYDNLGTEEKREALIHELLARSGTFRMRMSAIHTIGKKRRGYGWRLFCTKLSSRLKRML